MTNDKDKYHSKTTLSQFLNKQDLINRVLYLESLDVAKLNKAYDLAITALSLEISNSSYNENYGKCKHACEIENSKKVKCKITNKECECTANRFRVLECIENLRCGLINYVGKTNNE